ncbi:MAG: luciferase family protein [Actinomycetota bacterium]
MPSSVDDLPVRPGPRPTTTPTNPHTQLDQIAPVNLQLEIAEFMFALSCVDEGPSQISVPGARAMLLQDSCLAGPPEAFMIDREFCHIHPPSDGSLHLNLPPEVGPVAIEKGWAENHPMARLGIIPTTVVMVYGPRDRTEVDVVKFLVAASHRFAHPAPTG